MSSWVVNDHVFSGPEYSPPGDGIVLLGRPVDIRLTHALVEPLASIPAAPVDRFRLVVAVPDDVRATPGPAAIERQDDGAFQNPSSDAVAVYVVTLAPIGAPPPAGSPVPS